MAEAKDAYTAVKFSILLRRSQNSVINLLMEKEKLAQILNKLNQPKFRLEQIQKAIYQDGIFDWDEITTIPKDLRELLKKEMKILSFEVKKVLLNKDKRSKKALLELPDGNYIETVLISPKLGDWSVCVSTQAGCPLGCEFCATGKSGFKRNLTDSEIADQVLFWKRSHKISDIVFMGMGEPFLNWENMQKAIEILHNPKFFNLGWRSISISTSGLPEGIEKLAKKFPQINLAISLHFANDHKRDQYMPINKKYNLDVLRQSLRKYFSYCRRKVFIEYIMLAGINDSKKDAEDLIKYLKSIGEKNLLHVNLISYNATFQKFHSSSRERIKEFKNYLLKNSISATIRKSLGGEIQGACGQLAGK